MDVAETLAALANGPNLSGASCTTSGVRELFDAVLERGTSRSAAALALRICGRCPVLDDCGRWVASLPPESRPTGVVAGVRMGARRSSAA